MYEVSLVCKHSSASLDSPILQVQYYIRGDTNVAPKSWFVKEEKLIVVGLTEKTEYGFQVTNM
jgi:hypothetical protein